MELKNIPATATSANIIDQFAQFKPLVAKVFNNEGVQSNEAKRTVTLRIKSNGSNLPALEALFKKVCVVESARTCRHF